MSTARALLPADPALFNPETGRLDAARIARELNVPVGLIADAVGRKAPGVRKHPDSSSLQGELRRILKECMLVESTTKNGLHPRELQQGA